MLMRTPGSACRGTPTLLIVHEPSGSRAYCGEALSTLGLYINSSGKPRGPASVGADQAKTPGS